MKYTQDGRLICNETDLAVLHRAAERGKAWGNISLYTSDEPAGLPPIPSVQVFVLLFLHPQTYQSYLGGLQEVMKISNDSADYYFTRTIDTELRKPRRIVTPFPYLMALQRWILRNILDRLEVSPVSFAYRKGVSLADNAAPHLGKRRLVKLDIRHFFESISSGKVYTVFEEAGYAKPIATLLTKLCTLRGCLPQGAPTSPALANLVMRRFDARMNTYCLEHGISYTRYSDDLTFSADEMDAGALIRFARSALREEGFALNFEKIRVLGAGAQHRVCGLVVNEKLSVPKAYRKKLRQEMYYLSKYPIQEHIRRLNDPKYMERDGTVRTEYYLRNLLGRLQYVNQFPHTEEFRRYASIVLRLLCCMEIHPENPACSGYLFGGEEELERETIIVAATAVREPDKLLSLLIPGSAQVVQRLVAEGKLRGTESSGYRIKDVRLMHLVSSQGWEYKRFAYERTLRLLKEPAVRKQTETIDLLSEYLEMLSYDRDFPYGKFNELDHAISGWRRRRCRERWEKEKLRPDTVALEAEEPTREESAVLCVLSLFPDGVTESFLFAAFGKLLLVVERLTVQGWLEWGMSNGTSHLALRPEGFMRFFASDMSVWAWRKMSHICDALLDENVRTIATDGETLALAVYVLRQFFRMPGIPEETAALCMDTFHEYMQRAFQILRHRREPIKGDNSCTT